MLSIERKSRDSGDLINYINNKFNLSQKCNLYAIKLLTFVTSYIKNQPVVLFSEVLNAIGKLNILWDLKQCPLLRFFFNTVSSEGSLLEVHCIVNYKDVNSLSDM